MHDWPRLGQVPTLLSGEGYESLIKSPIETTSHGEWKDFQRKLNVHYIEDVINN